MFVSRDNIVTWKQLINPFQKWKISNACLGTTLTERNDVSEEIISILIQMMPVTTWLESFVYHFEGKTEVEGIWERRAEEDIWD
jgi:hypothetical protein